MRLVLSTLLVLSLAACTGQSEFEQERGRGDAPVGEVNNDPADITNFPDGYGNIASKCDGNGWHIFQVRHTIDGPRPAPIVVRDEECVSE